MTAPMRCLLAGSLAGLLIAAGLAPSIAAEPDEAASAAVASAKPARPRAHPSPHTQSRWKAALSQPASASVSSSATVKPLPSSPPRAATSDAPSWTGFHVGVQGGAARR